VTPTPFSTEAIVYDGQSYEVVELTEFGFKAPIKLPGSQRRGEAFLVLDSEKIPVEFRVRSFNDGLSSCTFINFSIADSELVRRHLKRRTRAAGGLEDRSYDELASGNFDGGESKLSTEEGDAAAIPNQKGYVKSFALMALMLAMVALVILAVVFLRSRSSLGVANAALVGNSIQVNSKIDGEIVEMLVAAGDVVRKGDVLVRLTNPEVIAENKALTVQLDTAKAKVAALQNQKEMFMTKLKFARRKLQLDREVATKEFEAAQNASSSAMAAFNRLRPFVQSGAVTQLELSEAENQHLAEQSNVLAKENLLKQIEFAIQAAETDVLIIGDRVDDELGKIQTDLDIALAEEKELKQLCQLSAQSKSGLEVIAPRDGTVYVAYRQPGEFIRMADELIGLSYPGETWAAGNVTAGQASRVLPGQPVKISIPATRQRLDGVVMAVGHRAMYSKGHYSAEFRGATATDVPIKVYIEDLPENVPAGIRLDMAINTGFGLKWLDDSLGYKLQPIGSKQRRAKTLEPEASSSSQVTLATVPEVEER